MRQLTVPFDLHLQAGHPTPGTGIDEVMARPVTAAVDRSASFTQLAEENLDASYALAAVILGDQTDARDATHDAVVKAWRAWPTLRSADAFEPWFQRILVNSCRDRLRRRSRRTRLDALTFADGQEHDLPSPERDPYARTADRDALEAALQQLNVDERIVVVPRYFADLPIDEIAARVDAPVGTVKSRLHRGIAHLRAAYDAGERSPSEAAR
jgi:RNA polymerase sigma-70 factor (ECF subfamily)